MEIKKNLMFWFYSVNVDLLQRDDTFYSYKTLQRLNIFIYRLCLGYEYL